MLAGPLKLKLTLNISREMLVRGGLTPTCCLLSLSKFFNPSFGHETRCRRLDLTLLTFSTFVRSAPCLGHSCAIERNVLGSDKGGRGRSVYHT